MPIKMLQPKEVERLFIDLKECESLGQDIENAKKAGIAGIEILEERHKQCLNDLQAKYEVYGKRK